jgi:hypothetical protein
LLISILLIILNVKVKWDALVAMLLDWLYNIFTLVTIHSPSPIDGLESKDLKRSDVKILGLGVVDVGVGILDVVALALGSQPRQRFAKVQTKSKPKSHILYS